MDNDDAPIQVVSTISGSAPAGAVVTAAPESEMDALLLGRTRVSDVRTKPLIHFYSMLSLT